MAKLNELNGQIGSQMDFLAAPVKALQGIRPEDVQIAETSIPGEWSLVSEFRIDAQATPGALARRIKFQHSRSARAAPRRNVSGLNSL